jgi:hypothetical protein
MTCFDGSNYVTPSGSLPAWRIHVDLTEVKLCLNVASTSRHSSEPSYNWATKHQLSSRIYRIGRADHVPLRREYN